jgi:hypothetical protein
VICDLVTAVVLFSQFNVLPSRALFVLANRYLHRLHCLLAWAHFPRRIVADRQARRRTQGLAGMAVSYSSSSL